MHFTVHSVYLTALIILLKSEEVEVKNTDSTLKSAPHFPASTSLMFIQYKRIYILYIFLYSKYFDPSTSVLLLK